jgi:hypothetical protein
MGAYRCFAIDFNDHIRAAEVVDCADDRAAALAGEELLRRHPAARQIEIWQLDRRIGVLTRNTLDAA